MRAIAIVIVIAYHSGATEIAPGGFAVTLFFFTSGYLITSLLIQEERAPGSLVATFYLRRFLRLAPALVTMIFLVSIAYLLCVGPLNKSQLLASLFYGADYYQVFGGTGRMPIGPLWSLSVEEHYYLIYPVVFTFAWRWPRRLLAGLIALTVIVLLWRSVLVLHWQASEDRTYYATDTRIDSILFGSILAVLLNIRLAGIARHLEHWATIACAAILLVFSLLYRDTVFRETFRYSLQGIALLSLFYSVVFAPRMSLVRTALELPPVTWIGKLSYSLYLYHFPMIFFAQRMLPGRSSAGVVLLSTTATLAAASFSYYCVERPCWRWRDELLGGPAKHRAAGEQRNGIP